MMALIGELNCVPRYYVVNNANPGGPADTVYVADARTGKRLATFTPPSGVGFGAVAASADDRTFVLQAQERLSHGPSWSWGVSWYVLQLTRAPRGPG